MGFDGIVAATERAEAEAESAHEREPEGSALSPTADDRVTRKRADAAARAKRSRAIERAKKLDDPAKRVESLIASGLLPAEFVRVPDATAAPAASPEAAPAVVQVSPPVVVLDASGGAAVTIDASAAPAEVRQALADAAASPGAASDSAAKQADADLAAMIAGMDAEQFSALVVGAVDGGAVALLGPDLAASEAEKALLTKALAPVLKKHATPDKLTPEDLLLLTFGLVYGPRAAPKIVGWLTKPKAAA